MWRRMHGSHLRERSLFAGEPHAVDGRQPLLGGAADFCASFFHVEASQEAGVGVACLNGEGSAGECARKSVAAVARLRGAAASAPPLHVARYTNCFRGSSRANVHAEQFLMQDARLLAALPAAAGGRLTIFLTYQPCHHSSGHDRAVTPPADGAARHAHSTSCTTALLAFRARELEPRAIALDLRVPNLYRAHWVHFATDAERELYAPRVASARAGLLLLANAPRTTIRALDAPDWAFLISLCAPALVASWAAAERAARAGGGGVADADAESELFTPARRAARGALDHFVSRLLESVAERVRAPSDGADSARAGRPPTELVLCQPSCNSPRRTCP
ncbi:hypothetical protein KFE25_003586 [Diacronema lutheri]|uniref:APOBEC-like N-terminal domain-containing protein n=1 Tax=Diacronema lutheri TaxID=2081491 RepID=A0A8J6C3R5_DIALT|nr:hypothetical protein KFE25_003586 [Diacronema lutheri]